MLRSQFLTADTSEAENSLRMVDDLDQKLPGEQKKRVDKHHS